MSEGMDKIAKGFFEAMLGEFSSYIDNWRRKGRLKKLLRDKRFPKGFRSTKQLSEGIGCDSETTKRLLLAIGARKSEKSDEWTLRPPQP